MPEASVQSTAQPESPARSTTAESPPRRRWRFIASCVLIGFLAVACIGYLIVTHLIRSRLEALVCNNLDGELQKASVYWIPPLHIVVRDARVTRGNTRGSKVEMLSVERIDLKLGALPHSGKPVDIQSLLIRGPSVHLPIRKAERSADGSNEACPPAPAPPPAAAKFSDRVRVSHLQIANGSVIYQDPNRPDLPGFAVQGIKLDVGPSSAPGGEQAFDLSARDPLTDLHADGMVRPDELSLAVKHIAVDVRFDPECSPKCLPQPVSDWPRRFATAGALSIRGKGQIPFQHPKQSTFDGAIELTDASANWPGLKAPARNVHIKLLCDTQSPTPNPGAAASSPPAMRIQVAACDADWGGALIHLDTGEFIEDLGRREWKLDQLAGHASGAFTPAPAARTVATTAPASNPAPLLRGRVDFTATAAGPIVDGGSQASASAARYEILAFPRDLAFKPASFPCPIEHVSDGVIRAGNGAVTFRDMAGSYGGDRIVMTSARIPIPNNISELWKVETRLEEMFGSVTFYQPGPVYPKGIDSVVAALRPEGTFAIGNGRFTLNHRLPQAGVPAPKNDFALNISCDGSGAFSVTDRRIPVTRVRGSAALGTLEIVIGSDGVKDGVVQGTCMEGNIAVHMTVAPHGERDPTLFQGEAWAHDMNVALLCNVFGVRDGKVSQAGGKGAVHGTFSIEGKGGKLPPAQTLRAAGEAEVIGADYWEDPIVAVIAGNLVKASRKPGRTREPGVCDAAAVFHIANRVVTLDQAALNSPSIGIQGSGTITFDKQLDLQLVATPIGDLKAAIEKSAPPVVGEVAGDIASVIQGALRTAAGTLLYQYRITGTTANPQNQLVPAPALSDAGAFLFGRMLNLKNGGLLNELQRGAGQKQAANATSKSRGGK